MFAFRLLFQSHFRCVSTVLLVHFGEGYFLCYNKFLSCHKYAQSNPVRNTVYSQLVFFLNDQHLIQSAFYVVQVNEAKKETDVIRMTA